MSAASMPRPLRANLPQNQLGFRTNMSVCYQVHRDQEGLTITDPVEKGIGALHLAYLAHPAYPVHIASLCWHGYAPSEGAHFAHPGRDLLASFTRGLPLNQKFAAMICDQVTHQP